MTIIHLDRSYHHDLAVPNKQPLGGNYELDTSSSLASSLIISFDLVAGFTKNLASQEVLILGSEALKNVDQDGINVDFSAGASASCTGNQIVRFSHEALIVVNSAASESIITMAESPGSGTQDRGMSITSGGNYSFSIFDGAQKTVTSSASATTGDLVHLVATSDGINIKIYVNGILEGTTAAGDAFTGYSTPVFVMGQDQSFGISNHKQIVARAYNRALTDDEVLSLSRDIYQVVRSTDDNIYFIPSAAVGDVLTAQTGAYVYTGTAVELVVGSVVEADSGAYIYTGTNVGLITGETLVADSGSYIYTGTAADFRRGSVLVADSGAYVYTGTAVDFTFTPAGSFTLSADSGSYVYAGTAAGLIAGRIIAADSGSYIYTGTAADLVIGFSLAVDSGAYIYTGTAITFLSSHVLTAQTGAYLYTGTSIGTVSSANIWTIQADSVTNWTIQ